MLCLGFHSFYSVLRMNITTPEELAALLEEHCQSWTHTHRSELLPLLEEATVPESLRDQRWLERTALGFWFKEGKAQREQEFTTDADEKVGSVQVEELLPAAFAYYQQRYEQSTNPYLKARYALVLWNAPKPNAYGRMGNLAQTHLLEALATADCTGRDNRMDCIRMLGTCCDLALLLRHRQPDTIQAVLDRFTGVVPFEAEGRIPLLRLIADTGKLFKPNVLTDDVSRACEALFDDLFATGEYEACEALCPLARTVAQRRGLAVAEWFNRLGRTHEALAEKRLSDPSGLAPYEFYRRATEDYRAAGNTAAYDQAFQRLNELKAKIRLGATSFQLNPEDAQTLQADIDDRIQRLTQYSPHDLLEYLTVHPEVLPDYASVRAFAEQHKGSFFFASLPTSQLDENKNTRRVQSDEEVDKLTADFYEGMLQFRLASLVPLLAACYRAGNFSYDSFCAFLEQSSWIAQPLAETAVNGQEQVYTWKDLIYPILRDSFQQLAVGVDGGRENFVLSIDSLTVKLEGLLRDLLQRSGANTTANDKHQDLREVFIESLLNHAVAQDLFDENTRYFLRYLLLAPGMNLRNNVAHCYYRYQSQYSFDKIIMLLCGLLRIANFRLEPLDPPAEAPADESAPA
jgi:hypothetical protein